MASVPEITVSDWQIAMSRLVYRDPGAHDGDVGRVSALPGAAKSILVFAT
jgi:hypothetical protein